MFNRFWQGVLMGMLLGMFASRYLRGGADRADAKTTPAVTAAPAVDVNGPRRVLARLAAPAVRRG